MSPNWTWESGPSASRGERLNGGMLFEEARKLTGPVSARGGTVVSDEGHVFEPLGTEM